MDLIIRNGQVVSGQGVRHADVAIRDGRIAAVGERLDTANAKRIVDATGTYILPGVIDAHVHKQGDDTYESVSRAAIYGGVTTIVHHYYPDSTDLPRDVAQGIELCSAGSMVDFQFHVRLTRLAETLAHIPALFDLGLRSFKMFMAYRKRGTMVDDYELTAAMDAIAERGGIVLAHAENGLAIDYLEDKLERQGAVSLDDYLRSRPTIVEGEAVYRAIALAKLTGCPLYVVHVTCADALQPIIWAKDRGDQVLYAETCPQYLTLTAEHFLRLGPRAKIAPPLRTAADIEALWRAIQSGDIDTVGSDHVAYRPADKQPGETNIFRARPGAPGIETLLPLVHEAGVNGGRIALPRLVQLLAERPAQVFGLAGRKGSIQPGADADLVVFDSTRERTLGREHEHSNAYYSMVEGIRVKGLPVTVFQRGACLLENGELKAHAGQGRFLAQR
ncbi:MAG: amidohydrolase family protein [Chloroflexi bacterium]|nr:amidohydrolase family protein [Chloroflexota bacterium]